jgi:hypothetical protein
MVHVPAMMRCCLFASILKPCFALNDSDAGTARGLRSKQQMSPSTRFLYLELHLLCYHFTKQQQTDTPSPINMLSAQQPLYEPKISNNTQHPSHPPVQLFKRFVKDPVFVIVEVNSPDDVDIPTKVRHGACSAARLACVACVACAAFVVP